MYDVNRWYIRLGNWCFNIALLNLLWFIFTTSGLVVLGIFPATAALFSVLKQMVMEDENPSVIKLFIRSFKSEFIMSNLLGYLFLIIGLILYLNLEVIQLLDNGILQLSLASITIVIALVYFMTLIYLFPILVHFNFKLHQYPVHALVLAVAKPFHTMLLMVLLAVILTVFLRVPGLTLLFGLSTVCFAIMKVASFSLAHK